MCVVCACVLLTTMFAVEETNKMQCTGTRKNNCTVECTYVTCVERVCRVKKQNYTKNAPQIALWRLHLTHATKLSFLYGTTMLAKEFSKLNFWITQLCSKYTFSGSKPHIFLLKRHQDKQFHILCFVRALVAFHKITSMSQYRMHCPGVTWNNSYAGSMYTFTHIQKWHLHNQI